MKRIFLTLFIPALFVVHIGARIGLSENFNQNSISIEFESTDPVYQVLQSQPIETKALLKANTITTMKSKSEGQFEETIALVAN